MQCTVNNSIQQFRTPETVTEEIPQISTIKMLTIYIRQHKLSEKLESGLDS